MQSRSLLVIERDPQIAGALELFFGSRGYAVSVAPSRAEARRRVIFESPEVVLLGSPGGDGDPAEVARELRSLLAGRDVPIVHLSPDGTPCDAADAILTRPFRMSAILAALRNLLRRRTLAPAA